MDRSDRFDLLRFDLLRKTMKEGPGLSLQEWAAHAGIPVELLKPSRRRRLTPERVCNLVGAAERLLSVERGRIERWLDRASDQGLEQLLTDLLRLVACSKCGIHFERQEGTDFFAASGICRGCTNQQARVRQHPHTANYAAYLLQYESDVRRVNPLLADAILVAANDSSRAVTYAYLGELSGLTSVEVRKILADLDMLKPIKSRGSWGRSLSQLALSRREVGALLLLLRAQRRKGGDSHARRPLAVRMSRLTTRSKTLSAPAFDASAEAA